jgi:hypothetical protein
MRLSAGRIGTTERYIALAGLLTCAAAGLAVGAAGGRLVVVIAGLGVIVLALRCSPHAFAAAGLLILGTDQLSQAHPIRLGAVSAYTTDILVALVLLRAWSPRARAPTDRIGLGPVATALSLAWMGTLLLAAVRGLADGSAVKLVIRDGAPAVYLPALYLGFARLQEERKSTLVGLLKALAGVVCVLVLVFLVSRLLNLPFTFGGASGLANVPLSNGTIVQRDYGFSSAFILYPALALAALSYRIHSPARSPVATFLLLVGVAVTLTTLIRAEIGGLLLGAAAIFVLPYASVLQSGRRVRVALQAAIGLTALIAYLAIATPSLLTGTIERVDPFASQASLAAYNANYRAAAAETAIQFTSAHFDGGGFIATTPPGQTYAAPSAVPASIDAGFAAHSAIAWLLYYTGWPGLLLAAAAWLAVGVRSFTAPAGNAWLHPAFVGIWLMLLIYDLGAAGLVAQTFVMGTAALALALRFGASVPFQANDPGARMLTTRTTG